MDWLIGGTDPIRREIEVGYDSLYKPNIDTYSRYSTSSYNSNNRRSLNRLSSIDENYSLGLSLKNTRKGKIVEISCKICNSIYIRKVFS